MSKGLDPDEDILCSVGPDLGPYQQTTKVAASMERVKHLGQKYIYLENCFSQHT